MGWRGPLMIWPGRGVTTGVAGLGEGLGGGAGLSPGLPSGGTMADPLAMGGRNGEVALEVGGASAISICRCSCDSACAAWRCSSVEIFASDTGSLAGSEGGGNTITGPASLSGSRGASGSPERRSRMASTTSSSTELECVFFSFTPSSGRRSIITLGLTSSSLASSLMRVLLINS